MRPPRRKHSSDLKEHGMALLVQEMEYLFPIEPCAGFFAMLIIWFPVKSINCIEA